MEFLNEKNEVYYTLRWWKNSKLTLLYKAYLFYILSHLAVKVTWVSQLFDQETKFQSETCYHTGDIRFSCTSRTECKPKVVKCKVVFSPTICVLLKRKRRYFCFKLFSFCWFPTHFEWTRFGLFSTENIFLCSSVWPPLLAFQNFLRFQIIDLDIETFVLKHS